MPAPWKLGFLALSLLSPLCATVESPIVNPYPEVPDVSIQTTTWRAACRPRGLDHTTLPIPTTSSVATGIPEETPGEESTDSAASAETSAVPENPDKTTGASFSHTGPPGAGNAEQTSAEASFDSSAAAEQTSIPPEDAEGTGTETANPADSTEVESFESSAASEETMVAPPEPGETTEDASNGTNTEGLETPVETSQLVSFESGSDPVATSAESQEPGETNTATNSPPDTSVPTGNAEDTATGPEVPGTTSEGASFGSSAAPVETSAGTEEPGETSVNTESPENTETQDPSDPTDTVVNPENPTDTAASTQDPTETGVETENPTDTGVNSQDPTDTNVATEQPPETSEATAEPPNTSEATDNPVETSAATEEPTITSEATQDPPETPGDQTTSYEPETTQDIPDTTAGEPETSPVTEVPEKTTRPPKESSDDWQVPTLTPEPTEPAETETAVTGTDGVVVTYTATKDPKETDLTEKKTTTDDDGFVIIIWPGGWKWVPKGGHGPTNRPPAPTKEPKHNDDDDDDDDDDKPSSTTPTPTSYDSTTTPTETSYDSSTTSVETSYDSSTTPTETSTGCSATEAPECTITISYTWMGDDYSSTTLGECPATSGCITGEQSTTTTYVAETLPVDEEFEPPEEIDDSNYSENADEETNDWFEDWFDENGFSLGSNVLAPECDGERIGVDYECFLGLFPTFCTEVNENPKEELSRDLKSSDKFGGEEKRGLLSSWLTRREEKCEGYTYTFEWSGEDGDNECDDTCLGAFGQIAAMCAVPGDDGIYAEGQVDVGCGKYNYKVSENSMPTTTQTEEEPTQTTTPLESQAPVCNDVADFKGHADISWEKVQDTALKVCARHPLDGGEYTDDESKKLGIWDEIEKKGGVQFRYSIYWIEGCILEGDNTQSPYQPMGLGNGHPCVTTFMDMWYGCNNNEGVGGYMDVGCIRYRVDAGV